MNVSNKVSTIAGMLVEQITKTIPPKFAQNFFSKLCAEIEPMAHLSYLSEAPVFDDPVGFEHFCRAAIYAGFIRAIETGILADGEVEDEELALGVEILQSGMDSLRKTDLSYEPFYPLTTLELGDLIEHAKSNAPVIKIFTKGVPIQVALSQMMVLYTKSMDYFDLSARGEKLVFRMIIDSDGVTTESEVHLRQLFDNMVEAWRSSAEDLVESSDALKTMIESGDAQGSAQSTKDNLQTTEDTSPESSPEEILEAAGHELSLLIGLQEVKTEINRLSNFLQIEAKRKAAGLASAGQSLHFIFTGNPGTGKTTVARIVAKLLFGYEILKEDKLVETDRSSLVGGYIGQTAIKTKEVIDSAENGLLFIDEAYALSGKGDNDFGQEAIDTLLKAMEDRRDSLVVVAAGYTNPMKEFLESNPGLESRFTRFINFPDYSVKELCKIFEMLVVKNQYAMTESAMGNLGILFNFLYSKRSDTFGNGRLVRNVFEKTLGNHSDRLVQIEELTREDLTTISAEDLPYDVAGIESAFDIETAKWIAKCPNCDKIHKAPLNFLGKKVNCKCEAIFTIPFWNLIPNSINLKNDFTSYEEEEGHLLYD